MARRRGDEKRGIAYIRVSTDTTKQELGAEGQRTAIEQWAKRNGVTIAEWFVEEVSGAAPLHKRPVLLEALAALRGHRAGALVFAKWDRFARDPITAAFAETKAQEAGARLVPADGVGGGEDASAQLVKGVLLVVAAFERATIGARIKAAKAVLKRRGMAAGFLPFGKRVGPDGKTLEEHPQESATLAEIRAMRAEGMSIRKIEVEARNRGLVGRVGTPLSRPVIHDLVREVTVTATELFLVAVLESYERSSRHGRLRKERRAQYRIEATKIYA